MSEEKKEIHLTPAYSVTTAAFIVENCSCFNNLVFNVVGELTALSELIRTKNGFIFLIKLKSCEGGSSCAVVNIVVDGRLALHGELSSFFHAQILFENLSASMVKCKGGIGPLYALKTSPDFNWRLCSRNLINYINHEDFLTRISISEIEQLRNNHISIFNEEDSCKRDIISYQGTVTKVFDADGGIYELDGKVTLYLTCLFLLSKYIKLDCNDSIILHNVHALRIFSKIKLVCCGLSFVNLIDGLKDDVSYYGTSVASGVFCIIQKLALNFYEVEWLLTSISCLTRNLCPFYIPSDWLQEAHQNRTRSDDKKSIFAELFPAVFFGKTEIDGVPPHSVVRDFCSYPHSCTFFTKPCFFSPVVQYLSLMELKEYAVNKATSTFGVAFSNWKHFAVRDTDVHPKMIIVGLLTASAKNGTLSIRDNSGKLECIVTASLQQSNQPDILKPSNIDHVIKVSDYNVIVEQFRMDDPAVLGLASSQVHHKVYVLFSLKDVVFLRKSAKNRHCLQNNEPTFFEKNLTSLAQQMSSLNIDVSFDSSIMLSGEQSTENVVKKNATTFQGPSFQHSAIIDARSSLIFCCTRKIPFRFNYKKGYNFGIQAVIIAPSADPADEVIQLEHFNNGAMNMTETNKSNPRDNTLLGRNVCSSEKVPDGPKVMKYCQMSFSGPAVKFFHVLHEGCIYKAKLSSAQYQDVIGIFPAASMAPHVINITHLDELEHLENVLDDTFLSDQDCEYDDKKILSVEEALSKNSFKELISLFGIIAKREHLPSQIGFDVALPTYFDESIFKIGIGSWQNEVIQLEIRDSVNELVSTRIFLDVSNAVYPLGLLAGALVKLTALDGHVSRTNNVYFRSTVVTCVEILEHSPASIIKSSSSASLLAEYMGSERLLLSENLVKWESSSFCRFVCLVDIQHIWNVELHLACADCKETIPEGNTCSNFGCRSNATLLDKTTLSFLASDGSACATVRCKGDHARQILQMRENEWWTLLTSSGISKTWRNDISKEKNRVPNDVGGRILRSATTEPLIYRTLLAELEWRKSSSRSSALQSNGKLTSPHLFCTRLEEVTYLSAITCYLSH